MFFFKNLLARTHDDIDAKTFELNGNQVQYSFELTTIAVFLMFLNLVKRKLEKLLITQLNVMITDILEILIKSAQFQILIRLALHFNGFVFRK